jgi:DNA-binding beta-propeller fold protein YncE
MLKSHVHLILRLVAGAAVALAFALSPQLAQAQAPGSLAQLASPNNCLQATTIEEGDCPDQTAEGLSDADDVAVSPDGSDVYVISFEDDAIAEFSRGDDGSLDEIGCIADASEADSSTCDNATATGLVDPEGIAISPDGNNVYVAAQDSNGIGDIAEFVRNDNGTLTQLSPNDCIAENTGETDGTHSDCANQSGHGIEEPLAVTVSPDGQNVYAVDEGGGDIAEFTRSQNNGSLSQLNATNDCISEDNDDCATTNGTELDGADAVAVSPDGSNVYVGSEETDGGGPGGIAEFSRNYDGSLNELGCVQESDDSDECGDNTALGIEDVTSLVVSPDGQNVYAVSPDEDGTIAEFARGDGGALNQLASPNDCIEGSESEEGCGTTGAGLEDAVGLTVSPDGASLYVANTEDDCCTGTLAEFSRASDGSLAQLSSPDECISEGEDDCGDNDNGTGLGGGALAISPDGANVYVIGGDSDISEFSRTPVTYTLSVALAGTGSGSVSDGTGGIECPTSCSNSYTANTPVTLTATPASGSTFTGWSGACSGTGNCQVDMSAAMNVTATFTSSPTPPAQTNTLQVELAGTGTGVVSDGTGAIACLPTCQHAYATNSQVTLTATPGSGSTFAGWSGACSGTGTCQLTMSADMNVSASFTAPTTSPTPAAPTPVLTSAPSAVTDAGAGFLGSVDPEGLPTTVYFQYGLDKRYTQVGTTGPDYTGQTAGQQVAGDFNDHTVGPISVSGLVPNAIYHVRLVATNSDGTTFGPDVTFTTALAPAPSTPTLGQTFNIAPVSGLVLVLVHGHLVPLTQLEQIGPGVTIDTLHGTLKLTISVSGGGPAGDAAAARTKTQTGQFGGAVVRLHQNKSGSNKGLTTVMMVESAFKGAPSQAICAAPGTASDGHAASVNSKVIQLLHASAHGKFATSGRYSAATVRGTIWDTIARCDGTLIHAIKDEVVVTDFIRHKTIVLHAGQSYLAPGPST